MRAAEAPCGNFPADTPDARFPYQIGYDAAGVVVAVGEDVKGLRVGDEVYTRLPEASRGNTDPGLRF